MITKPTDLRHELQINLEGTEGGGEKARTFVNACLGNLRSEWKYMISLIETMEMADAKFRESHDKQRALQHQNDQYAHTVHELRSEVDDLKKRLSANDARTGYLTTVIDRWRDCAEGIGRTLQVVSWDSPEHLRAQCHDRIENYLKPLNSKPSTEEWSWEIRNNEEIVRHEHSDGRVIERRAEWCTTPEAFK